MTNILEQSPQNEADTMTSLPESSVASHWAFVNDWKVEPQPNDRAPVFGEVTPRVASAAARRSTTRRKHQAMFKEWSQDRHD